MRSVIACLLVLGLAGCGSAARQPLARDADEPPRFTDDEAGALILDALEYYRGGPCVPGDEPAAWVRDVREWNELESVLCDPAEDGVIVETHLGEYRENGCASLPIPYDSLGADFEYLLCGP